MSRPRRWAAAAGVGLALLATTAPATAKTRAAATASQTVSSGSAAVVIAAGSSPATAPTLQWTVVINLGAQYGVLTNLGNLTPGSVTIVAQGLNIGAIDACSTPWNQTFGTCPGTAATLPVGTPLTTAQLPAGGVTWYLKLGSVSLLGSFKAYTVSPTSTAITNS